MAFPSTVLLRTQSDARLVALARTGHDRAFDAIVERYRRPLLRACRRILPEARAEDALQQALVAAWTGLRRGDEVLELRAWLYRIVRNTALNQLRTAGYDLEELVDTLGSSNDPEEEVARRAVVRETLAAVAALPERQRDALLRTAVQGHGQDEVARDLGLTDTAMRQLVHRARVNVRAAATAFVPLPAAAWFASAGARAEPIAGRIAELVTGAGTAGATVTLAKAGTVVVLAGGARRGAVRRLRRYGRASDSAGAPSRHRHRHVAAAAALAPRRGDGRTRRPLRPSAHPASDPSVRGPAKRVEAALRRPPHPPRRDEHPSGERRDGPGAVHPRRRGTSTAPSTRPRCRSRRRAAARNRDAPAGPEPRRRIASARDACPPAAPTTSTSTTDVTFGGFACHTRGTTRPTGGTVIRKEDRDGDGACRRRVDDARDRSLPTATTGIVTAPGPLGEGAPSVAEGQAGRP